MDLKEKYPKLCWDCEHARATWSKGLEEQGMTGCAYPLRFGKEDNKKIFEMTNVSEFGEGWIYSARKPLDRGEDTTLGMGSTINDQPVLKEVKSCLKYSKI